MPLTIMTEVQYEEHNTCEKDFMIFLIFTTKSCWFNNKVVFLRRKDLNTEDYERFYFKKKVLG